MSVAAVFDSRDTVAANPSVTNHRGRYEHLFFGQTCTFLDDSMIQLVRSSLAKGFNFFSSVETRLRNSFVTI
jgi:hypothetical protein